MSIETFVPTLVKHATQCKTEPWGKKDDSSYREKSGQQWRRNVLAEQWPRNQQGAESAKQVVPVELENRTDLSHEQKKLSGAKRGLQAEWLEGLQ